MREFQDGYLTQTDAAHYLGRSPRWLQEQLKAGDNAPPYFLIGKNKLFRRSELDRWVSQFRSRPVTEAVE